MPRPTAQTFTQQQLRVFAAVAQERSLSAAARTLGMAEPTIYGHLDNLERLVGSPLVVRTRGSRQTNLTDAGVMLLPTVTAVLKHWEQGVQALRDNYGLDRKTITVGSMPHFSSYILPRLVELFAQEHPEITVRIEIGRVTEMVERIKRGLIDLAITFGPVRDDQVQEEVFDSTELVIVGPPGHRFDSEHVIPFEELAHERLIVTDNAIFSPGRLVTDMAEGRGVSLNAVMVAQDIQPRIQAMLNGLGIGPTFADSVEPELESGRLRILPVEGFPVRVERVILSPRSEMPMAVQAFREHLIRNRPAIGNRRFLASAR
jgi:molybdate transport repressor ModE-like protein